MSNKDKTTKRKKRQRNKGRDVFADYYYTNKTYSEENAKRSASEGKKEWSSSEKMMLGACLLGVIGIIIRYVIL